MNGGWRPRHTGAAHASFGRSFVHMLTVVIPYVSHNPPETVQGYHGSRENIQCDLCDHNGNFTKDKHDASGRLALASYGSAMQPYERPDMIGHVVHIIYMWLL